MALSVNEISYLKQWVYALLTGDPNITGGVGKHPVTGNWQVYDRVAPEGAAYPFVVFQFMPEADRRGGFGARIFSQGAILVKAINQGTDESEIWRIADAVDNNLQDAVALPAKSGLIVLGCSRDMVHNQATEDNGVQYNELGGRYMVQFYMPGQSVTGVSDQASLPPSPTVQDQLNAILSKIEDLQTMAQHIQGATKYLPFGTIITASRVITKPAQNTSYEIDTTSATAPVVITLYASTGDQTDNEFVRIAGTQPVQFVLDTTAPDTCPLPLVNTYLTNTGESQSFREQPNHIMEAH